MNHELARDPIPVLVLADEPGLPPALHFFG